jgi:hypothetical protein
MDAFGWVSRFLTFIADVAWPLGLLIAFLFACKPLFALLSSVLDLLAKRPFSIPNIINVGMPEQNQGSPSGSVATA